MRDIKFRAWDEDGFMFYPTSIEFNKLHKDDTWVWSGNKFGQLGSAITSLMQYTGKKDKYGKEIYEGDIIKYFGNPIDGLIEDNEAPVWVVELFDPTKENRFHWVYFDDIIEVIGNIYENPELIKLLK